MQSKLFLNKFVVYLVCSLPVLLITGPFLPDLIITTVGLYFIILYFIKKVSISLNKNYIFFFILFYLCINLSSIFSFDPLLSLKSSLFYIRHFFFLIAFVYLIKNYKNLKKIFLNVLIFCYFILICDGFYQFFFDQNILGFPKIENNRLTSFFDDEPILGSYIFRFYPLLVYLIIDNFRNKKLFILLFVISILALSLSYLSGERKAFIFITLFNIGLLFLTRNFFKIYSISIIVLITFIFFINENFEFTKKRMIEKSIHDLKIYKKINEKSSPQITVFSLDHHRHYVVATKMFLSKPLFGHGIKSFRNLCHTEMFRYSSANTGCSTHPHNFYIQLLAETGIFSFCLLIAIFFLLVNQFYLNIKHYVIKKNYLYSTSKLILLGWFFLIIFPFVPHGNFFNNWLSIINFIPLSFLIYEFQK